MKKLLLILVLAFVGCSTETIEEKEEVIELDLPLVGLSNVCGTPPYSNYYLDEKTFLDIKNKVDNMKESCLFLEFVDIEGDSAKGYYSHLSWFE